MNIRSELSARLKMEMGRKGVTPLKISQHTRLSKTVIDDYLNAGREIQFDELRPICESLNIGLMWLLSADYKPSHLTFRALPEQDLTKVSRIENAFLVISSLLPPVKPEKSFSFSTPHFSERDTAMLQAGINQVVSSLRNSYPTVEDLYRAVRLPILPVSAGENGFDAFIMNAGMTDVVCVNRDKAPARIHFSLLHELAHFLFHRGQDVPVDMFIEGYFNSNVIAKDAVPEYIANKFAQQFIFSLQEIVTIAPKWKNVPNVASLIAERRTTPDVLAFAIFDYLQLSSRPVSFSDIRNTIKDSAGSGWGRDQSIVEFIEQQGRELKRIIFEKKEEFSDSVWAEIKIAWEIKID